jgi:hypothetical protein
MYRLFYNPKISGDILFGLLDPEKKTERIESKGDLALLYAGAELVGFNLFNAKKVYPFPEEGAIFAPKEELVKALNGVLTAAGVTPLAVNEPSGYFVAEISAMEEHPLDEKAHILTLDLGNKTLTTVSWYPELSLGDQVVIAVEGTILIDGSVFHSFVSRNIPNEASLMSAKELRLTGEAGAYKVKGLVKGSDFFRGGK